MALISRNGEPGEPQLRGDLIRVDAGREHRLGHLHQQTAALTELVQVGHAEKRIADTEPPCHLQQPPRDLMNRALSAANPRTRYG